MKYKYIILLIIIIFSCKDNGKTAVNDNDKYSKVVKRLFNNGVENLQNKFAYYYDDNYNIILYVRINKDGEENNITTYIYENNELIEYIDISGTHKFIEKLEENGNLVILTKEKKYVIDNISDEGIFSFYEYYEILNRNIFNENGEIISSEEENIDDAYYIYCEYNKYGDIILKNYENEKTNGIIHETYILEYDNYGNKLNKKIYENNILINETNYKYNKNNLLIVEITDNYKYDNVTKTEYNYNNGKIESEVKWLNNEETHLKYFEYDKKNRLIKEGEKTSSYEQYWIYEYY